MFQGVGNLDASHWLVILVLVGGFFTLGQLSVEFVNVGGWLTYGDLALDSWLSLSTG